jgi:hypothetical protein
MDCALEYLSGIMQRKENKGLAEHEGVTSSCSVIKSTDCKK